MSSVIRAKIEGDVSGNQIDLDRDSWFSHEAKQWIDEALENPKIGPEKVLSIILHHGLGLSLDAVARLQNTTKNIVAKRVITGTKRLRGKPPWRREGASAEADCEVTLADWLELTCANLGDLTESTQWVYSKVKEDLVMLFGEKLLGDITEEDMTTFATFLKSRGLASKTIESRISIARALFRDAVRMGCIRTNPFSKQQRSKKSDLLPV